MTSDTRWNPIEVLFVESDDRALEAAARDHAAQRPDWALCIEASPARALDRLRADPERFAAVLAPLGLEPGGGVAFLADVESAAPEALRVLLASSEGIEQALNQASSAQICLGLPCSPAQLQGTLQRALALRSSLQSPRLAKMFEGDSRLPPVPATYQRLAPLFDTEEPDILAVARAVESDPPLSARVLQLVNSSLFGLRSRVVSLRDAVLYVGSEQLKRLALHQGLTSQLDLTQLPRGYDVEWEMQRALFVGRFAEQLLGPTHPLAPTAFLAGSLRALGQLLLASREPEGYAKVLQSRDDFASLFEAERAHLGATHAEVGAFLLAAWGLPDALIEPVLYQERPPVEPIRTPLEILETLHYATEQLERIERGETEASAAPPSESGPQSSEARSDWFALALELHATQFGTSAAA